ncbi:MAG: hypothetical protein WBC22_17920 [Sedimentisphaerales bacterium]
MAEEQLISVEVVEVLKLIASGGFGAAIVGIVGKLVVDRKLQKQKAEYDKQLESFKSKSDKKHTVHKLQFEKEFEIYKELWEQLIRLVPWVRSFDELLKPKHITQRVQELPNIIRDISHTVYTNQPFYHPEIFEACESILNSMPKIDTLNEIIDKLQQYSSPEVSADVFEKHYDELLQEMASVCKIVDTVRTLIRNRIW